MILKIQKKPVEKADKTPNIEDLTDVYEGIVETNYDALYIR